jgi:hypothetical protein
LVIPPLLKLPAIRRYQKWLQYETGYFGSGPSPLDKRPDFRKPWIPRFVAVHFEAAWEEIGRERRKNWRARGMNFPDHDEQDAASLTE